MILLLLILLTVTALGYLIWGHEEVSASSLQSPTTSSTSMRQYYITPGAFLGAEAKWACASGYHFASFWEILDPSNLKYNSTLGFTSDDSGHGPSTWASSNWVLFDKT